MAKKRFGLLTGGGDVPGLNSVIRALAYQGIVTEDEKRVDVSRLYDTTNYRPLTIDPAGESLFF